MKSSSSLCKIILVLVSVLYIDSACAKSVKLPVPIDFKLIEQLLITQLYTQSDNSVRVWKDHKGCSFLDLANPTIDNDHQQIHLVNDVQSKIGTQFNGKCVHFLQWSGKLESWQKPELDSQGQILRFPITEARTYDKNGNYLNVEQLQNLIVRFVEPKLADLKIDLKDTRQQIEQNLKDLISEQNYRNFTQLLNSLNFEEVGVTSSGLILTISFDYPEAVITNKEIKSEEPLNDAELKIWRKQWQQWETFVTDVINQATNDADSEETRETLMDILIEARSTFEAALSNQNQSTRDPVRLFFNSTWDRLSPILRQISSQLPSAKSLRYLSFIAATDILYELDKIGAPLGMDLSSDGLRRLSRSLIADQIR